MVRARRLNVGHGKEQEMMRLFMLGVVLALGVSLASADTYWVAWEGDDWPENQGWRRVWGNWDGLYHGPGAYRTLEDGILTYDSRYDDGVFDYYYMERPGQMDPDASELFVMEWRLKVDVVNGLSDPTVGITSDESWVLGLTYAYDHIRSMFESSVTIPFAPGVWHEYRVSSANMHDYDLSIDGELARHGAFRHLVHASHISWGDTVQGASSMHEWDWFRFGCVPEPAARALMLVWVSVWRVARRR